MKALILCISFKADQSWQLYSLKMIKKKKYDLQGIFDKYAEVVLRALSQTNDWFEEEEASSSELASPFLKMCTRFWVCSFGQLHLSIIGVFASA